MIFVTKALKWQLSSKINYGLINGKGLNILHQAAMRGNAK
jgi:hypothetical protein